MKNKLLLIFAIISLTCQAQSNWIKGHAVWNYDWFYPVSNGSLRIETMNDTVIQGHTCQKLKCDNHEINMINQNGDLAHYITTSYNYIYFEQDTVWYWKNNMFSVLYDFTATQGQVRMLEPGVENQECNDSSYLFIDSVYSGSLNGETVTFYHTRDSSTNSIQHGGIVNSHFGKISATFGYTGGFFPVMGWCSQSPNDGTFYKLRCFQDDSLIYNPENVDCEYYTYLKLGEKQLTDVTVFPNPSSGIISLRSDVPLKQIRVMSILGAVLKEVDTDLTLTEIDLSELPQGTYYLRIENASGEKVVKPLQLLSK